jgi:hypothetical protein
MNEDDVDGWEKHNSTMDISNQDRDFLVIVLKQFNSFQIQYNSTLR